MVKRVQRGDILTNSLFFDGIAKTATGEKAIVRWALTAVAVGFLALFLALPLLAVFTEALRRGIDAYLASLQAPPGAQVEKRLSDWFAATEKYPKQLHEMDKQEYMAMKQKETQRMRAAI